MPDPVCCVQDIQQDGLQPVGDVAVWVRSFVAFLIGINLLSKAVRDPQP